MRIKKSRKSEYTIRADLSGKFNGEAQDYIDAHDNEKLEFSSSKLMLSELKDIYKEENERNKNLENKASIGITLLGVLLTVGINDLDIAKLLRAKSNDFYTILLNLILVISLVSMLVMLISTLHNFFKVIKTREYRKMSTDGFSEENAKLYEDRISMGLIPIYIDMIEENRSVNDKKYKLVDRGIKYLIISIISYVIYSLIYKII